MSWFLDWFLPEGRNCLTKNEFRHGLTQIMARIEKLERYIIMSAKDVQDALTAERTEITNLGGKLNNVVSLLTDVQKQLSDLKNTGGATREELDSIVTQIAENKAAILAEEAAADAALAPAPAPTGSGGTVVSTPGTSEGSGTVGDAPAP